MSDNDKKDAIGLELLLHAAEAAAQFAEATFINPPRTGAQHVEVGVHALEAATKAFQLVASQKDAMSDSLRERVFGKTTE